jgi:two-component system nitrate/nitrite response regulator NarL
MLNSNKKYKILIADDHDLVRDGYKSIIQKSKDFEIAGVVGNGKEVLTFFETHTCDILILDINMPKMNGIQTIEYLNNKVPSLKILVVSMINSPLLVKKVIELGVDGYLFKTTRADVMITALKDIIIDNKFFEESIELTPKTRFITTFIIDGESIDMTARELEIIKLVSQGKSNMEIAEELFISLYTVQTHRKNINAKLDIHNSAELTSFAIKYSLISSV